VTTAAVSTRAAWRELVGARDLLWTWTLRNVRARYQQSILGWFWAIAQPAAQVAIFAFVFTKFVPVDTGSTPYVLFSYVAIVPWTFLSTALTDMSGAIVENMRLVTKIYFPREVLPLSAMLARALDFVVASALVLVLVIYYGLPLRAEGLLLLAVAIVIQLALTAGLGLAAAAANTFVRDVRPLLVLALQLWFYGSPIIYPMEAVPAEFRALYALNPVVGILEAHRAAWLNRPMPLEWLASSGAVAVACLVLGYWFFKRSETLFSDIA